jgi:hypothetical protein
MRSSDAGRHEKLDFHVYLALQPVVVRQFASSPGWPPWASSLQICDESS